LQDDTLAPDDEDAQLEMALRTSDMDVCEQPVEQPIRARTGWDEANELDAKLVSVKDGVETINLSMVERDGDEAAGDGFCYNMLNQQAVGDKSVADGVEALIGVYLLTYGPGGALRFMNWLGLNVRAIEVRERF
jgi:hypothetical protein